MKKIYEAFGKEKKDIIDVDNELKAFTRNRYENNSIGLKDLMMVGRIKDIPMDSIVDIHWNLNALIENNKENGDIIILEPFFKQVNNKLANIDEVDTYFNEPIKLSKKAMILMPVNRYEELIQTSKIKRKLKRMNIRLYEGEEDLAFKMLMTDKGYIFLDITKDGYVFDKKHHPDIIGYTETLLERQEQLAEELREKGINIKDSNEDLKEKNNNKEIEIDVTDDNYKMITGLTKKVEGKISLDEELYATTDIGKIRENQEDAVLLIKDKEIPEFKMMAVADGMGGWSSGEIASDTIINRLKDWFENLSDEEKKCYYTGVEGLQDSLFDRIELDIQCEVEWNTWHAGGSTLVCAIVGKNDTLIANVGDSRAYIAKDGKLVQHSREDTVAQENLEKGKTPSKEASRFDKESNQLVQCIGMDRRDLHRPYVEIINNNDYDMLLLFSDGVTDCLSDDDIAVVCRNTDKKELADKIVEKAIRHDSIQPEEFIDYVNLNLYIPGGKDNTTAAVYVPKEDEER